MLNPILSCRIHPCHAERSEASIYISAPIADAHNGISTSIVCCAGLITD